MLTRSVEYLDLFHSCTPHKTVTLLHPLFSENDNGKIYKTKKSYDESQNGILM